MTPEKLIETAARKAGDAICSIKPTTATLLEKEGSGNFVTLADKTSEAIIFSLIREHFPLHTVLSEETASTLTVEQLSQAENLWIIDPLDGTTNYQNSMQYSCVSIGYAQKGKLQHAVVYDPFRKNFYSAGRNDGAWHNNKKMRVREISTIDQSKIITANSYDPAITRKHLETILKTPNTPWVYIKGSAALEMCEIAGGQADIYFSFCSKPWDNAAAFLILEESGGICTDLTGKPVNFFSPTVVAGNKKTVTEFLRVIK